MTQPKPEEPAKTYEVAAEAAEEAVAAAAVAAEKGEEDDATETWQEAESDVLDLVESLKQKLAQIHPGIGDQLTLARFVRFIEANSTCL